MDVTGRGLSVQPGRAVFFSGSADEAGQLLRDIGLSLVNERGQIRSGNLRLIERAPGGSGQAPGLQTGLRRFFNGGSNELARQAVYNLAIAYADSRGLKGVPEALNAYLQTTGGRIGSQSFIKLLQALGIDDEGGTIGALNPAGGRLITDDILQPAPGVPLSTALPAAVEFSRDGLLEGLDVGQPVRSDHPSVSSLQPVQPQPPSAGRAILRSPQGLDKIFESIGVKMGQKLGSGGFGVVRAAVNNAGEKVFAVKTLERRGEQTIRFDASGKLVRSGEVMAAYLEKSDDPDYAEAIGALANEYLIIAEDSLAEGATQRETLLIPRESVKSYLREHGERLARGEAVPKLRFCGAIMPLMEHPDLGATLKKSGALSDWAAAGLIIRGLESLQGLARRGLIHRDIKPDNLFYNPTTGDFRMADFGLMKKRSKAEEFGLVPLQRRGASGTPGYMHARVQTGVYGPEVDLYSFAITVLQATYPQAMRLIMDRALKPSNKNESTEPIDAVKFLDLIDDLEEDVSDGSVPLNANSKAKILEQFDQMSVDLDQPTVSSFALHCLNQANRPYADWATRDLAEDRYLELQEHPYYQHLVSELAP